MSDSSVNYDLIRKIAKAVSAEDGVYGFMASRQTLRLLRQIRTKRIFLSLQAQMRHRRKTRKGLSS